MAWRSLPPAHRQLLESIGASQWLVAWEPLGHQASAMLISAGHKGLSVSAQTRLDRAVGAWVQPLQVVLINERYPALDGLDSKAIEAFLANVAWQHVRRGIDARGEPAHDHASWNIYFS
jgi:hypothetical protein